MDKPFFFLTGMFRSGTTLIARMLNSHPAVACASDPLAPVFKEIRNAAARKLGCGGLDPDAPLGDYYFDAAEQSLMRAVQDWPLQESLGIADRAGFLSHVADRARPFSPLLADRIGELKGDTAGEILTAGRTLIAEVYGNASTHLTGFKETWAVEFVPLFLKHFPEARVIILIRDPRAVVASKLGRDEKYPVLFMARHWRKASAFA